jgi:hypothetical protein
MLSGMIRHQGYGMATAHSYLSIGHSEDAMPDNTKKAKSSRSTKRVVAGTNSEPKLPFAKQPTDWYA